MVENTARSAHKPSVSESDDKDFDKTSQAGAQSESEKSLAKMTEEVRGVQIANETVSLFEQVLKNDSATGAVDLRGVFNVAVSELDDDSPVKKYIHSGLNGRKEVLKSVAADCTSGDATRQNRGNEQLKQIMYFEAVANLSSTQGRFDESSNTNRSYALHVLAGQELSSGGKGEAAKLLAQLENSGDAKLAAQIESIRKDKENQRERLIPLAEKQLQQLKAGDLQAAKNLTHLHLQQVGQGNNELSQLAQKSNEVVQEAQALSKRSGERTISVDDARATAPRQGKTPTGTLVLPEDGSMSYKQYDVKQGKIFDQTGKLVGSFQDNGSVLLNGSSPFQIATNEGTAFHGKGTDGERLDLVANADKNKFTGFIATADSQEAFTVTGGKMYDASGKMIGKLNQDGQIETSENGATTWQSLNAFRAGAIVVGEENGRKRSYEASASASDGHILLKDAISGKHIRHDVKMGMLINSQTGEQVGWVNPPSESADGNLSGGSISSIDKDGKLKQTPFAEQKDMIFSLQRVGVSGAEASLLQGMTTKTNDIFNIGEAKRLQLESKLNASDTITSIKESESGIMGKFNLKMIIGRNAAEIAEQSKKININNAGFRELEELASGDQSAIARVDSIKQTRDNLHAVLHPVDAKPVETAPVIEIPTLDNQKVTASVNGHLRLGHQVFTIKNGDLYEVGRENQPPAGKMLPGYQAQFNDGDKIRVVDLARENRVLMKFTSDINSAPAHLIGMGEGHMTGGLGYQQGGLIDVRKLSENARRFEIQARKGNDEYFANRPYVTGALGNWAMGDREALLKDFAQQLDKQVLKMNGSMQELFHFGFDPKETSTRKLDSAMLHTQAIMHVIGAQSADTTKMAIQGQQVQGQVNEAAVMAVITVATAGAGAFVAGAANLGKVTLTARAAMAAEGLTCAGAGAIISGVGRASDRSHLGTNLAAGSIEGVMMFGGNQSAKLLSKMDEAAAALKVLKQSRQSAQQTLMKTAVETVKEAAPAMSLRVGSALSMGTGFSIASSMRNGEGAAAGLDAEKIAFATFANLVGQYANARLGDVMGSKAVLGAARDTLNGKASVLGGIVRNTGDGFVNSGVEGGIINIKEQRQANPNGQIDFMAATWSALDFGAIGGATSMSLGGALRAAEFSATNLANRYAALRADMSNGSSTTLKQSDSITTSETRGNTESKSNTPEKRTATTNSSTGTALDNDTRAAGQMHMQATQQHKNNNPTQPRKLESLWRGLRNAVEETNNRRATQAPPSPELTPEPELTPQQRKENEIDFQRRVEAGEYSQSPVRKDNKPLTGGVEISKKVIENHIRDINRVDAASDNRPTELIKAEVYVDDTIGPRQLDTISAPAKVAFDKALSIVAKSGEGAAEDIANQATSVMPKLIGHTREVAAQVTLAKETQGEIDPNNTFVRTAIDRVEGTIAQIRNASKDLPETDYFSAMQDIAGRRGMNRWMEQNAQRREIQHEVANDRRQRQLDAAEDPSKINALRRNPEEVAAATVAARACQIELQSQIAKLESSGQSAAQQHQALRKLTAFQKNLEQAREDASDNPTFKAYFAEMDAYMKKVFAQPES